MSGRPGDRPSGLLAGHWLRGTLTGVAAVAAFVLAPLVIPNLAFRLMATAAAAAIVWDHRFIGTFYATAFRQLGSRLRERIGQTWLLAIPGLLFCAILLWLFINIVVRPIEPDWGVFRYETGPVLLGALTVLLVFPSAYLAAMRAGSWLDARPKWVHGALLAGVASVFFWVQLTLAVAIYLYPGWDVDAILKSSFGLADGSLATVDRDYFTKYPNNLMLMLILAQFSKLMVAAGVTNLLLATVVLNVLVLLSGVVLTYLVARKLAGTGTGILTLLPSAVFLVVSPWIAVPYSDSFGLLFPVLLLYLYLKSRDTARLWSRLAVWAAIGFVGIVGFSIKPTVVFVLIGVVAVALATALFENPNRRQVVAALASVAVALGVFAAGSASVTFIERRTSVIPFDVANNPEAVPITHFLKMGATGYGAFTQTDVWDTLAITDPDARFRNGLDVYFQRVGAMGPAGYADFLSRKAIWTFGDGTFHMWTEGVVKSEDDPFLSKDPTSRSVQEYLWAKGGNFPFTMGVWQSFWLVMLLLVAAPVVLRGGKLFSSPAAIMRISVLGLLVFLLFFETRSRYLYLYVPFFILLATLTLHSVMSRIPSMSPPEPSSPPPARQSVPAGTPASQG